jgi:transposase
MGEYSEIFVAFDIAKKKHAVAIAEGGRTVEVRFMGDVESHPAPIERTIKRLANRYDRLHVCFEAGPTGIRALSPGAGVWPRRHCGCSGADPETRG